MDLITLITAVALLLIAIGIGHKSNGSWPILGGFAMLIGAVVARIVSGDGPIHVGIELFRDSGISLLIAATYMGIRKLADHARPFAVLGVASLILSGLLFGAHYMVRAILTPKTQSILLELGPDDSVVEVEEILNRYAQAWERAFPTVSLADDPDLAQVYLVGVAPRQVPRIMDALHADTENVDHVEINLEVSLSLPASEGELIQSSRTLIENDPFADRQWALDAVQVHEAHLILQNATPVRKARVAILDTGVESSHEDLEAVYVEGVQDDAHGHGTHCAGIAGATTNNRLGIASLNWEGRFIEVLGFRALSETGQGSLESIAQAIIDATEADADVISMSLGSRSMETPRVILNAVEYALDRDVIVVASAGNSNEDALYHFPSNIEGVVAVAAIDQNLVKAKFSNTTERLTRPIAAPGVDLYSTFIDNSYKPMSGTSMATPVVSGLVGIMRSMNPEISQDQVYSILHETGTEVPDTPIVGRIVNAEAALQRTMETEV